MTAIHCHGTLMLVTKFGCQFQQQENWIHDRKENGELRESKAL